MCGSQTLLASVNDDRFLTRCGCGCLHLVWDNATIRLDERDLGSVVRYLHTSFPAPKDDVQVWLLAAGLRFSVSEFEAFRGMLSGALVQLREHQTAPATGVTPHACTLPN